MNSKTMLPISENDDNEGAETSKDLCLKDEEMLSSEDKDKDNLETNSMNTSLDVGLKLISSSSTSRYGNVSWLVARHSNPTILQGSQTSSWHVLLLFYFP